MRKFPDVYDWIMLALFVTLLGVAAFAGCSMEEWRDIGHDAITTAPEAAVGVVTPGETAHTDDWTATVVAYVAGLASGWYTRRFKEKRYGK